MSLQPALPTASPEVPAPTSATSPAHHTAAVHPNGATLPTATRLPQAKRGRSASRFFIPAAVVLLVIVGIAVWLIWFRGPAARTDLVKAPIEKLKVLQFKIVERGFLEAKNNNNIICDVKTGNRGAPKIKTVLDNGTPVKKGELLMQIDDSYLNDQLKDQKILRDNAEQDWITAKNAYPGLQSAITVAEKNLTKWIDGDFPQQKNDLDGRIENAKAALSQQVDRTDWTARMVKKTYMTASQLQSEEANLQGDQYTLDQLLLQKKVLVDYTNVTQTLTLTKAVADAKDAERVGLAKLNSTKAVFEQQDDKYKDLELQIKQCQIYAPSSGILVYYTPETTRMGSGSNQSIIAQGEPVQYGQKMMSIPDLTHMQVNVRIHEAFIGHMNVKARIESVVPDSPADKAGLKAGDVIVKFGDRDIDYFPDLTEALRDFHDDKHMGDTKVPLKVLRDKKEVELELNLKEHAPSKTDANGTTHAVDPAKRFGAKFLSGLKADVRVDMLPGKVLKAHVALVAAVAAQQDWMSPDVKVYQAYIEIDESVKEFKLKPGLSAVCTIYTETLAENVVAAPVQAILPAAERGGDPRVIVATPSGGTEMRNVKLLKVEGKLITDDKYVAIEEGLNEGEEVVLNPKAVLGDKDKKAGKSGDKGDPNGKSGALDKGKGKMGGPGGGLPGYQK